MSHSKKIARALKQSEAEGKVYFEVYPHGAAGYVTGEMTRANADARFKYLNHLYSGCVMIIEREVGFFYQLPNAGQN